jgi:divalent metal cation (Fe/Co/Zn/Cd) transporter
MQCYGQWEFGALKLLSLLQLHFGTTTQTNIADGLLCLTVAAFILGICLEGLMKTTKNVMTAAVPTEIQSEQLPNIAL